MSHFYICTEAFVVTIYKTAEDEAEALHYEAMPQAELHALIAEGLNVPRGEEKWFRAGQRVHEDHPVFRGVSGHNRRERLFVPEDDVLDVKDPVPAASARRGPGRPSKPKVEVTA